MPGILRELLVYICQECCRVQGTEYDCGERVCHRLPGNEPSPDLRGVRFIYFSPTGSLEAGSPRLGELSSDDATPGLSSVPRHLRRVGCRLHAYVSMTAARLLHFQPHLFCWSKWETGRGGARFHTTKAFPANLGLLVIDRTCVTWASGTWVCLKAHCSQNWGPFRKKE